MMMLAIDTETNGLSTFHGCRPYAVTACQEDGTQLFWQAEVDPLTRVVLWPPEDLEAIQRTIERADRIVGHNLKFDAHMLLAVLPASCPWPWEKCDDTIIAAHLLGSNQPKNLTDLVTIWLGSAIQPLEDAIEAATKEARRLVQSGQRKAKRGRDAGTFAGWRIAAEGLPEMPGAKGTGGKNKEGKLWKADMWLPRAVAMGQGWPIPVEDCTHRWDADGLCSACSGHRWHVALAEYANCDSEATLLLWQTLEREIKARGLWAIYRERMRLPAILAGMERRGVTGSVERADVLTVKYKAKAEALGRRCVDLAAEHWDHDLQLAAGASVNGSLRVLMSEKMGLPPVWSKKSKTATPTLDKTAMAYYQNNLVQGSPQLAFVNALLEKRELDSSLGYLASYRRYRLPAEGRLGDGCFVLHPSIFQTGTDTLRMSSSDPNSQNFSKKKDKEGLSLRYVLGPLPGREWWSLDAQNIELRIPAYGSGESLLIDVFERPDDPPYFGSYHLAIFDVLHPALFTEHGKACKDLFEDTWYQWVKNGNFSIIYGAQQQTADAAYHVPGAFAVLQERFPAIAQLNRRMQAQAAKLGWVETLPDKRVDPTKGYPILAARGEWGRVLPTTPLNYHVQSTACWWMACSMVKVDELLTTWRRRDGFDGYMTMQIHDELVLDLPKRADPRTDPKRSNLARVRSLQAVMASCGDDICVPTPVAAEYNPEHWGEGFRV